MVLPGKASEQEGAGCRLRREDAQAGSGFQDRGGQAASTTRTPRSRKLSRGTLLPTVRQGTDSRGDPQAPCWGEQG